MIKGAASADWHQRVTDYLKYYGIVNYCAEDRCNVHDALILGCHYLDLKMVDHALSEHARCDYISQLHLEPRVPINPVHALGALLNGMYQIEMNAKWSPDEKAEKRKAAVEIFKKLHWRKPEPLFMTPFKEMEGRLTLPLDLFARVFNESQASKEYDDILLVLLEGQLHMSEQAYAQLKTTVIKFKREDWLPKLTRAAYHSNGHYVWPALSAYYDPDVHDVDELFSSKQALLKKPKNSLKDYPDQTSLYTKKDGTPRKMYITAAGKIIDKESLYNRQNTDDTPVRVYGTSAQIEKLKKKLV